MIIDTISEENTDGDCQKIEANANKPFILVRVGSDERPASETDIEDIKKSLSELNLEPIINFWVTHHNVDMQVFYV